MVTANQIVRQSESKNSSRVGSRRSGVYWIRVFGNDGRPVAFRRLNGDDSDGILHTEKTSYLNYRMRQFQRSALNQRQDHQADCNFFYYRYVNLFPLDRLYAEYVETGSVEAARDLEREL